MAKEAFYFSHDYGARNDPKLQKVRIKLGHEGKSVFWDLIEMLYEEGGKLLLSDIDVYAYTLRTTDKILKSVISDFDLFKNDGHYFWSESAKVRLEKREEKSQRYSDAAKSRWDKSGTEFKMDKSQFYIIFCYNENEAFFKMGITSEYISRRYSGKKMPYEYLIILQIFSDDYLLIEQEYNKFFAESSYLPLLSFGGYNECFSFKCLEKLQKFETEYSKIKVINSLTAHYNFIATHKCFNATHLGSSAKKESKEKESDKKTKENNTLFSDATQSDGIYPKCIDLYNNFILKKTDVSAKINGKEGSAMKKIIAYLKTQVKNKENLEIEVPNALDYIFSHFDDWGQFHKEQLNLNQIESNLINIINSIKNGKSTAKNNNRPISKYAS